jgi:dTDP-glucose pyrophosphorylase
MSFIKHIVHSKTTVKEALVVLNNLAEDAVIFVIDGDERLIGSLTDGDIRRGLLSGKNIDQPVTNFIQHEPKFLSKSAYSIKDIIFFRENKIKIVPVLNNNKGIINIVNFQSKYSYLPLDAVIMAGGRGTRLRPQTDNMPKPLLKVGDKPIIEHNLLHLSKYGIDDFWISVNYLGEQIENYLGEGNKYDVKIKYIWEDQPLGTIGAISKIHNFHHEHILITNSDILTNLNYEDFYLDFLENDADMSVVTIPFEVNVPYAVMETSSNRVLSFKEKPTYTYYSNGGIYLVKRSVLDLVPQDTFFNTTDLMDKLLQEGGQLISYPTRNYWLDIGKPEDFKRAQDDIKYLNI